MSLMLKDIPLEDLPRERLQRYGSENLSNEELIAIILRTGTKNVSVKDLASSILSYAGEINNLRNLTLNKMNEIHGLGMVKAITLKAALELGRRVYEDIKIEPNMQVKNSLDVYKYFGKIISDEKQENFLAVYLDNQKRYIKHKIIFKGTLNKSLVHPREVFKEAFLESASAIVIMHNHPSGVVVPSRADDELTKNMVEVGNIMGVQVLDHLIVGKNNFYSYVEEGRLIYEK